MSPNEREFGELLGEMRAVRQQMVDMEARNTAEHSAVMHRLDGLETKLDAKASKEWVKELDQRTDSLEGTREKGEGAAHLVKGFQGVVLFALAFIGFLLTKGVFG